MSTSQLADQQLVRVENVLPSETSDTLRGHNDSNQNLNLTTKTKQSQNVDENDTNNSQCSKLNESHLKRREQKLSVILPQNQKSLATPTIVASDLGTTPSQFIGLINLNSQEVGGCLFTGLPSCTPISADALAASNFVKSNPFFKNVSPFPSPASQGNFSPNDLSPDTIGPTHLDQNGKSPLIQLSTDRQDPRQLSKISLEQANVLLPYLLSPEQDALIRLGAQNVSQHPLADFAVRPMEDAHMVYQHPSQYQSATQSVSAQDLTNQMANRKLTTTIPATNSVTNHATTFVTATHNSPNTYLARTPSGQYAMFQTQTRVLNPNEASNYASYHANLSVQPAELRVRNDSALQTASSQAQRAYHPNHPIDQCQSRHPDVMIQPVPQGIFEDHPGRQLTEPPVAHHQHQGANNGAANQNLQPELKTIQPAVRSSQQGHIGIHYDGVLYAASHECMNQLQQLYHVQQQAQLQNQHNYQQQQLQVNQKLAPRQSECPYQVQHDPNRLTAPVRPILSSLGSLKPCNSIDSLPSKESISSSNSLSSFKVSPGTSTERESSVSRDTFNTEINNQTAPNKLNEDSSMSSLTETDTRVVKQTRESQVNSTKQSIQNKKQLTQTNKEPPDSSNGEVKKKSKGGRKKKIITSEELQARKNRSKERNRVAAKRCRQKRKQFLDDLRRRIENLNDLNKKLQKENSLLKTELAQLKQHL